MKFVDVDVNSSTYIGFDEANIQKNPKFEVGDHVRILKYKKHFAKNYPPDSFKEAFTIKKLKTLCCELMLLVILMVKNLLERFMKKNFKKQIKQS